MVVALPAGKALEAVEAASKALTGDLVVIKSQVFRKIVEKARVPTGKMTPTGRVAMTTITRETLVPIDLEVHVSPLGIGLGAAVLAVAGLAGIVAWNGITLPAPAGPIQIFPGFKDTGVGLEFSKRVGAWIERHPASLPEGFITEVSITATDQSQIPCDQARVLYSGLSDFSRGFCRRNGLSSAECVEAWQELKARCSL